MPLEFTRGMSRPIALALTLFLVPVLAGCGRGALALGAGVLLGAALASTHEPPRQEVREVIVVQGAPPPPAPVPAPSPEAPAAPVAFDTESAREVLRAVDLGACRASGAPVGYGHARVTFGGDGAPSRVTIDAPPSLSPTAVQCIGAALGSARVAPFRRPRDRAADRILRPLTDRERGFTRTCDTPRTASRPPRRT